MKIVSLNEIYEFQGGSISLYVSFGNVFLCNGTFCFWVFCLWNCSHLCVFSVVTFQCYWPLGGELQASGSSCRITSHGEGPRFKPWLSRQVRKRPFLICWRATAGQQRCSSLPWNLWNWHVTSLHHFWVLSRGGRAGAPVPSPVGISLCKAAHLQGKCLNRRSEDTGRIWKWLAISLHQRRKHSPEEGRLSLWRRNGGVKPLMPPP